MPDRQSTDEDVKQLLAICGTTPGAVFTWEALEELLAPLTRQDRRFRTIYRAWIRYVRKWHNRKMVIVPGVGIRILQESERATDVCTTLGRTSVYFARAKTDVDDIRLVELTKPQVEEAQHVRLITHRLAHAMQEERERLLAWPGMPAPTPGLPQLVRG
jgi:hypothetical protein